MMELRCATPCSTGDIYAERRAAAAAVAAACGNRHVTFADGGNNTPALSLHSINIPTSFATFKPQTDLEPTYERNKRPIGHRTYPVHQRTNQVPPQGPPQPTPPPPTPQPQKPARNINCDYSLFNYDQDPEGSTDTAQPDLVSSNHVDGGQPEGTEDTTAPAPAPINPISPPEACRH